MSSLTSFKQYLFCKEFLKDLIKLIKSRNYYIFLINLIKIINISLIWSFVSSKLWKLIIFLIFKVYFVFSRTTFTLFGRQCLKVLIAIYMYYNMSTKNSMHVNCYLCSCYLKPVLYLNVMYTAWNTLEEGIY